MIPGGKLEEGEIPEKEPFTRQDFTEEVSLLSVGVRSEAIDSLVSLLDQREREVTLHTTRTPTEAVERLEMHSIDCIVCSQRLSERTGIKLLEEIRSRKIETPFLLFTDEASEELAHAIFATSYADYVLDAGTESLYSLANRADAAITTYRRTTELHRSQEYRTLAETATDVVLTIDEDSEIQFANRAVEDVFGYAPEELRGESLTTLMSRDLAERHREGIQRYLETGERSVSWDYIELPGRHKNGHEVPFSISFSEFTHQGERFFTGILRDISEQKRTRQELESRLRQQHVVSELGQLALETDDLDTVMERAVERVAETLGMDYCKVLDLHLEDEELSLRWGVGWREGIVGEATVGTERESQAGYTLLSEEPVIVEDMEAETRFHGPELLTSHDVGSGISAIIGSVENPWGILGTHTTDKREFTEDDANFVQSVAHILAIALESNRRERQFTALHDFTRNLIECETAREASETTVKAAATKLDLPTSAVALYNEKTGDLEPVALSESAPDRFPPSLFENQRSDGPWQVFLENETRVYPDFFDRFDVEIPETERRSTSVAMYPLGRHGVFITAPPTSTFGLDPQELGESLGATLRTVLDRIDRERRVQEHERVLEERTEELDRANHVNEVIRGIDKVLVDASSRDEIERVVCEELVNSGPYTFVWIGEPDSVTNRIVPQAWAGADQGYLETIDVTSDESATGQGPAGTAARTRETQVVQNILRNPSFEEWRQEALARGYRSLISIPIVYGETLYGVLNLYADRPNVFNDLEQAVLTETGETIGYAINAVESKRALVSDTVTELDFEIRDPNLAFIQVTRELNARFELETVVSVGSDLRLFCTIEGPEPDAVLEFANTSPAIDEMRTVIEYENGAVYECVLTGQTLTATVLNYGAVVRKMTCEGEAGHLELEIPNTVDVRRFTEMLQEKYEGVTLTGRRQRERPVQSRQQFLAELQDRLSDRQLEILEVAFFSGYFKSPRERTGTEIADSLGISQPTFNTHLRAGQQKICDMVFGEAKRRMR